ncbi:MAG: clan AA aspartic protease [Proteobacteria bacterium]|nr:clan AA aspartic protease [Pseudomonadota bacterium]
MGIQRGWRYNGSVAPTGAAMGIVHADLRVDLKPREYILADGSRKLVRCVGPVKVEMQGRDCVTIAAVMGDKVLLGAVPMESMDVVINPRTLRVIPNPENPNFAGSRA